MIPKPLANAIVVLVSLVWAANFIASVFVPGYQTDSAINFVFMTIVGGALALRNGSGPGLIERMATQMLGNQQQAPPAPPGAPPPPPAPPNEGAAP